MWSRQVSDTLISSKPRSWITTNFNYFLGQRYKIKPGYISLKKKKTGLHFSDVVWLANRSSFCYIMHCSFPEGLINFSRQHLVKSGIY